MGYEEKSVKETTSTSYKALNVRDKHNLNEKSIQGGIEKCIFSIRGNRIEIEPLRRLEQLEEMISRGDGKGVVGSIADEFLQYMRRRNR